MVTEKGTSRQALRDAEKMGKAANELGSKFANSVVPQLQQGHFWNSEIQGLKGPIYSEFRGFDATFVRLEVGPDMGLHIERLNRGISIVPRADDTAGYDLVKHGHIVKQSVMEMMEIVGQQIDSGKLSFKLAAKPHHRELADNGLPDIGQS